MNAVKYNTHASSAKISINNFNSVILAKMFYMPGHIVIESIASSFPTFPCLPTDPIRFIHKETDKNILLVNPPWLPWRHTDCITIWKRFTFWGLVVDCYISLFPILLDSNSHQQKNVCMWHWLIWQVQYASRFWRYYNLSWFARTRYWGVLSSHNIWDRNFVYLSVMTSHVTVDTMRSF